MKTNIHLWSYLAQFFLERKVFDKFVQKIETHFVPNNFFLIENRTVYEMIWWYTARQTTQDNMTHAFCMLDN